MASTSKAIACACERIEMQLRYGPCPRSGPYEHDVAVGLARLTGTYGQPGGTYKWRAYCRQCLIDMTQQAWGVSYELHDDAQLLLILGED